MKLQQLQRGFQLRKNKLKNVFETEIRMKFECLKVAVQENFENFNPIFCTENILNQFYVTEKLKDISFIVIFFSFLSLSKFSLEI